MAELLSIAAALPEHVVTLEDTKARIAAHFDDAKTATRYQRMAETTRIAKRHVVLPTAATMGLRTIDERQAHYARWAVDLSETSARGALESRRSTSSCPTGSGSPGRCAACPSRSSAARRPWPAWGWPASSCRATEPEARCCW